VVVALLDFNKQSRVVIDVFYSDSEFVQQSLDVGVVCEVQVQCLQTL